MKTYYRITLFNGADDGFVKPIVLAAAYSNSGDKPATIETLKSLGEAQRLLYPVLYNEITCEQIGENLLHIDQKIKGEYKTVCIIEKVELFEMYQSELMEEDRVL